MSIQITNSGASIKITMNGGSFYIPKPYMVDFVPTVQQPNFKVTQGTITIKYSQGDDFKDFSFNWKEVTAPFYVTIQALVDAIEAFQDSSFSTDVNIVGPIGQNADSGSVSVVLSSGVQTVNSSLENPSAGTYPSGLKSIKFTTSSNFVGNINDVPRQPNRSITFSAEPGKTLDTISYDFSVGTLTIDSIS